MNANHYAIYRSVTSGLDKPQAATGGSKKRRKASAAFGTQHKQDVYKQANVLGASTSRGYSDTHSYAGITPTEHDSRSRTPSTVSMAKATRDGTHKLHWANTLGTTGVNDTAMDAEYASNELDRLTRTKTPNATFGRDTRDSILKQNNELNVPLPSTVTSTVKYVDNPISKVDSRFQTGASVVFAQSLREDTLLLLNRQKVLQFCDRSEDPVRYLMKHPEYSTKYEKRMPGAPFHKSTTARADAFKEYNVMRQTVPVGRTDNCDYTVTGPVEAQSHRPRTGRGVPFSKTTTQRRDYQLQANFMNLNFPKYDTASIDFAGPECIDKLSRHPNAASAAIGKATRKSINEPHIRYDDIGATSVRTLTSNVRKFGEGLTSKIDSRFKKVNSAHFGACKTDRDDILKQFNSLGVNLPREAVSEAKMVPIERLAAALPKGANACFGTETRDALYTTRNNELNTTVPVGRTDNVSYVEEPISRLDSRFKTSSSAIIGDGPRYIPGPKKILCKTPMLTAKQVSSFRRQKALGKGTWRPHEFGMTKREDVWKQANCLRSSTFAAKNHNDSTYVSPAINDRQQSKFRRSSSASFGGSSRTDALLQFNVLKVKHAPHPNQLRTRSKRRPKLKTYRPKCIKPPRINRRPVFANGDIIMDKDCENFVNVWKRETLRRVRRQQALAEEQRELEEEEKATQERKTDRK